MTKVKNTALDKPTSDEAYGISWNGVTDVAPSKNAVYDKIESLDFVSYAGTIKAGDNILSCSSDGEVFVNTSYPGREKLKELRINKPGQYRLKFDAKKAVGSDPFRRLDVNGITVQSGQISLTTYATITIDRIYTKDDVVSLYLQRSISGDAGYVSNFRLYYNIEFDSTAVII